MACYPGAFRRALPENDTQARITPRAIILHTAVDAPGPTTLYGYFSRADVGAQSHFFVKLDGTVEQYASTTVKANANRRADDFAVSIETEDEGRPDRLPWTQAQVDAIVALRSWLCDTHTIPRRVIESPTGPGIGWHSQWNAADGSTPWSLYRGKTCPGKARVPQIKSTIIPRLQTKEPLDDMFEPKDRGTLISLTKALDELTKRVDALAVGPSYQGHTTPGIVPQLKKIADKLGI